jgi:hypothetical protein
LSGQGAHEAALAQRYRSADAVRSG